MNSPYFQSRLRFRAADLFDRKARKVEKAIQNVTATYISSDRISDTYNEYRAKQGKQLIVGSHSGRAGMNWVARLLSQPRSCVAVIEPFPFEESFFRFISWHQLSIDSGFFLKALKQVFCELWCEYETIIYASPWINGGLHVIADELKPDQLFTVLRDPRKTVMSLTNKGWYEYEVNAAGSTVPMPDKVFEFKHHYFSRIEPDLHASETTGTKTQIGRASWYWNTAYQKIFRFIDENRPNAVVFKLEDVDGSYETFCKLCLSLSIESVSSETNFINSKKRVPNRGRSRQASWTEEYEKEFLAHSEIFYDQRYRTVVTSV